MAYNISTYSSATVSHFIGFLSDTMIKVDTVIILATRIKMTLHYSFTLQGRAKRVAVQDGSEKWKHCDRDKYPH